MTTPSLTVASTVIRQHGGLYSLLDLPANPAIMLLKGVQRPSNSGIRTRKTGGFFAPGNCQCREGDGYNTRKGKKSTRLFAGFEPPGTLTGLGQSGSVRFGNLKQELAMTHALTIGTTEIRSINGLYSLNDFHKSSGRENRHRPSLFINNQQTQDLISEISKAGIPALTTKKGGAHGGTYACRELVIAYAAWISAAFHLKVIRVFMEASGQGEREAAAKQPMPESPPPPPFIAALTKDQAMQFRDLSESQRTDRHAVYCALALSGKEMADHFRANKGTPDLLLRGIERNIEQQKFGILLAEDALSRVRQTIEYLGKLESDEALGQIALGAGKLRRALHH